MSYTHREHPSHEGYAEASDAYLNALEAIDDGRRGRPIREKAYRRALAEMEEEHGPHSKPAGAAHYYLISFLQGEGQHAKATPLWAKLFRIEEKNYGVPHWELAGTLNNIGLHLNRLGDHDQGEVFLRWAIAMHEHTDHDFGTALFNLGVVLNRRDEHRRASVLFARAMTAAKKVKTRAESIFMLALDTNQLGTLDEAVDAMLAAVTAHRGDDIDVYGPMLLEVAVALAATDRGEEALIAVSEVVEHGTETILEDREADLLTRAHTLKIALLNALERPYEAEQARTDAADELDLDISDEARGRYDRAVSNWNWKLRRLAQDAQRDHPGDYVYTLCKIIADGDLETEISAIDRAIGKDTLSRSYERALLERKLDLLLRLDRQGDAKALLKSADAVVAGLAAARLGDFDRLDQMVTELAAPLRKGGNKSWSGA